MTGQTTLVSLMAPQYRNSAETFTSLLATIYMDNPTKLNSTLIKIILPPEYNNQSLVQIRWISTQNSGGGSRPSFAIDNLKYQMKLHL
jgi:hypothetical protein